ncbi:hypothetical protein [Streptomyces sp. 5-10]|uniref:hypothetical protein n=1 Tax=Streptomyces sp. 5-10 TaxID=878925 RepID=UPI00168B9E4F|nr:hypothetical protein [Streptomyces sp. 5-10]MBD3004657.1 hypothetical protein [Streptomyces sp. 5-10]
MATDEWLRPEHKGAELESIKDFVKRREEVSEQSMRSHISRYHDWFPGVVRLKNGRTKYFLPSELDDFLDRILKNDRPRSRAEKAAADVSRLREWVQEKERAEIKRREEYETAQRDLKAARLGLREAEAKLDLLTQ